MTPILFSARYGTFVVAGLLLLALGVSSGCSERDQVSEPEQPQVSYALSLNKKPQVTYEPTVPFLTQIALSEPVTIQSFEEATQALAVWRRYASLKPNLLLLSDVPLLLPVPHVLSSQISEFAATAGVEELARRSHPKTADVLLLPEMTVDIALRGEWFGKFHWVLPLRDPDQPLTLDAFRRRLLETGLANQQEVDTLYADKETISGLFRKVPVEIGVLEKQPAISGPTIIHVDLSYFRNLYKNDVATPVMNLVYETLSKLREKQLPVLAVTFSYGNVTERIALDVRFLGEVVAELFAHPEMFEQPVPVNWERQDQILFLNDFFQKEKQLELALLQEKELPEEAWVKFNLYQVAASSKQGNEALNYLAETVARDKVYAMEYLHLADMAYEKGRPDEALRMLKLADLALPENPMIRLQMAQLAGELGDRETALHLVRQLQALPWSSFYQGPIIDYINGFAAYLANEAGQTAVTKPPSKPVPAPGSNRGRILHSATQKAEVASPAESVPVSDTPQRDSRTSLRVLHPQTPQAVVPARR